MIATQKISSEKSIPGGGEEEGKDDLGKKESSLTSSGEDEKGRLLRLGLGPKKKPPSYQEKDL